jgi:hypothetical protein
MSGIGGASTFSHASIEKRQIGQSCSRLTPCMATRSNSRVIVVSNATTSYRGCVVAGKIDRIDPRRVFAGTAEDTFAAGLRLQRSSRRVRSGTNCS